MTEISIQPVQPNEIAKLAEIGRQTFIDTFASGNSPDDLSDYLELAFSTSQLGREMEDVGSSFYFATVDGEIAGYLKLNVGDAQTEKVEGLGLEIERIYVDARMHRKGIGKALFEFALKVAKKLEVDTVWLGVWEENLKAIEFYERLGFVPFGEHEFTIGKDIQRDILMRHHLR